MNTAVAIIIAIIGSTGLAAFIQFLISRHDKNHDRLQEIEKEFHRLCMIEVTIDSLTGKEAIELVRARR